jgi:hypothetical protein
MLGAVCPMRAVPVLAGDFCLHARNQLVENITSWNLVDRFRGQVQLATNGRVAQIAYFCRNAVKPIDAIANVRQLFQDDWQLSWRKCLRFCALWYLLSTNNDRPRPTFRRSFADPGEHLFY